MSTKKRPTLNNKVIVITGASSGAGRAMALQFAKHKPTLVLAARNEKALQDIAEECEAFGARVKIVPTDVTIIANMRQLAAAAIDFGNKIDVWVNNAGVLAAGELAETPVEIHTRVIETNLIGYIHGAHAVLPYFKQQQSGIIINNISIGGWLPVPYATGYSASKFGIRGFAEALRGELISYPDIYVCDLVPAFLDTPGIQHAGNFTGAALKPAPPVYDPMIVGRAAVKLALHPRRSMMVGGVTPLLKLAQFVSPLLMRTMLGKMMSVYFKHADVTPATSGNLFNTVEYGTSIHGGWNSPGDIADRKKKITLGAIMLGAAVGTYLLVKKGKR